MTNWKNPAVELPDEGKDCWITVNFNEKLLVVIAVYDVDQGYWFNEHTIYVMNRVTAWMSVENPAPFTAEWPQDSEESK